MLGQAAWIVLCSAAICLAAGRFFIAALARWQCVAPSRYDDCPPLSTYQAAKPAVPTMGGLVVLGVGVGVAALAGGLARREGWLVGGVALSLGAMGWWDDWLKFRQPNARGVPCLPKLLAALLVGAGLGVWMAGDPSTAFLRWPWRQEAADLGWGWVPLAMLVVGGCAHAVNLSDGMDGLAVGCVAIALAAIGLLAMAPDPRSRALVTWCASFAGACAGFLWFNSFPASVILGDVGALGLGAALGALSLLSGTALWLPIIGGVFVLEAGSVMLQVASYKWRGGRRIFRVAPIHHHFHLGGLSEPKVVARFWLAGVWLAVLGLTAVTQP
jgi:phospho-N-acetylmuramoyl-pentapeptide-transferase